MISIESTAEGFVLVVDGSRILTHSRRSPCVEIGEAENSIKQGSGGYSYRSRRSARVPLRAFRVIENSGDFAVIDFEDKLAMTFRQKEGLLRLSFSRFADSANSFRLRLAAWPDECIFGCGERFSEPDLKGRKLSFWVEDRGVGKCDQPLRSLARLGYDLGSGRDSTSYPAPIFVSTKRYWCAIETTAYSTLDFRRSVTILDSWAVPREIIFGWATEAPRLFTDMTTFLGRPPASPDWVYDGAWLELRGGAPELGRRLDAALGAGAKVAAVWSRDWAGPYVPGYGSQAMRECTWDASLYPALPSAIAALRARGIRFMGYVSPYLDPSGPLYSEASAKGYCVKDAGGKDYLVSLRSISAALIDLTKAEAFEWLKNLLKERLLGIGMSGWLADAGEQLPPDAVLASGESGLAAHNRWPLLWLRANREALSESGRSGELLFLARSGWLGAGRFANGFWSGERLENFDRADGLPATVPAALSLGMSGGGIAHSEVGGSLSFAWAKRSRECLARWMECAAFSPLMRLGDGLKPEGSAQFWSDSANLGLFARMSEVYAALKPYHITVAREFVQNGIPAIRHPWMHYEADPQAQRLSYQYMYGRDLMITPLLDPKAGGRSGPLTELYLPEDAWVHLWTSRCFRGGRVAVESPIGCPAVFYRSASSFAPLFDALRRTARRE